MITIFKKIISESCVNQSGEVKIRAASMHIYFEFCSPTFTWPQSVPHFVSDRNVTTASKTKWYIDSLQWVVTGQLGVLLRRLDSNSSQLAAAAVTRQRIRNILDVAGYVSDVATPYIQTRQPDYYNGMRINKCMMCCFVATVFAGRLLTHI